MEVRLIKHLTALAIKYVLTAVVLGVLLPYLTDLTFGEILWVAAAVTVLAYVLGDLMILPMSNNTVATIADAALALATLVAVNYVMPGADISFTDAAIAALVLGVGEWIFHKFVAKGVLPG